MTSTIIIIGCIALLAYHLIKKGKEKANDYKAAYNMPKVNEAIGKAGDIGWTAQSAVLQEDTYDGIVLLLLQYFDGKLY